MVVDLFRDEFLFTASLVPPIDQRRKIPTNGYPVHVDNSVWYVQQVFPATHGFNIGVSTFPKSGKDGEVGLHCWGNSLQWKCVHVVAGGLVEDWGGVVLGVHRCGGVAKMKTANCWLK